MRKSRVMTSSSRTFPSTTTSAPSRNLPIHCLVRGAFFLLDRGTVSVAGAEGGPLEGTAVSGSDSGRVSSPSRGSPQLWRPLGEPSVRAGGPFRRCASAGA
ncbi:unnamed protein product [Pleuronectes platessa]|uniref:Uncharacterized protein n=1 Tax=Pleuronectes platessa TaxID=8262 RepID=A0A9N7YRG8_PLEPL|nr:unnamed protein product [Pleuronectes platessa]